MFDGMADWMAVPLLHYEHAGRETGRYGLAHASIYPYRPYACPRGAPPPSRPCPPSPRSARTRPGSAPNSLSDGRALRAALPSRICYSGVHPIPEE